MSAVAANADMAGLGRRQRLEQRWASLKSERSLFESHWQELARNFLPRRGRYQLSEHNDGRERHNRINDGTPLFAARTLASGMMAGLTSPARPWFRLTMPDSDDAEQPANKAWLHAVEQRMREVFAKSNLYNVLPTMYSELGVFGTSAMLALDLDREGLWFDLCTVGTYWLGTNYKGTVDTLVRRKRLTVRQVVAEFGLEACSSKVQSHYVNGNLEAPVDVAYACTPSSDYREGAIGPQGFPVASYYWEEGDRENEFLGVRGYRESPILAPRWDVLGEDTYGSGPAMDALGDARALQFQQSRKAKAIDKMVDPPLQGPPELRNAQVNSIPGGITYVAAHQSGAGLRSLYDVRLDPSLLLEDTREIQDRINTAFYADLFLMLAMSDRRQITAREVEERHEEKLLMLGPVLERLNRELLSPLIDRTFEIMLRRDMLPPAPPAMEGADLKVEFISILAQAQKMLGVSAVDRLTGFVQALAQTTPDVLDKLDADQAVDEYAEMLGTSPRIVRDDDTVQQIREQRQQAQQAQQMAEMAGPARDAAAAAGTLADIPADGDNALRQMLRGMGSPA